MLVHKAIFFCTENIFLLNSYSSLDSLQTRVCSTSRYLKTRFKIIFNHIFGTFKTPLPLQTSIYLLINLFIDKKHKILCTVFVYLFCLNFKIYLIRLFCIKGVCLANLYRKEYIML